LDWPAFLRHSKTGQTNRLEIKPIRQRSQHPFPKSPRLHNRYVRYDFRNGRSLRPSSSNLIRSAKRNSDGFLKLESLTFFETPSPKHSLRKMAQKKSGVEIRCRALMLSTGLNAFQHQLSTRFNTSRQRNSTPENFTIGAIRPNQSPLPFNPPSMR
jgi:hypothetical protein